MCHLVEPYPFSHEDFSFIYIYIYILNHLIYQTLKTSHMIISTSIHVDNILSHHSLFWMKTLFTLKMARLTQDLYELRERVEEQMEEEQSLPEIWVGDQREEKKSLPKIRLIFGQLYSTPLQSNFQLTLLFFPLLPININKPQMAMLGLQSYGQRLSHGRGILDLGGS